MCHSFVLEHVRKANLLQLFHRIRKSVLALTIFLRKLYSKLYNLHRFLKYKILFYC